MSNYTDVIIWDVLKEQIEAVPEITYWVVIFKLTISKVIYMYML